MSVIIAIVIFLSLMPKVKNWIPHHHCKSCHAWFSLKFLSFDTDTVVAGHDQSGLFGDLLKTLKILGIFGGTSYIKDSPFLREFGTYHYLCKKCGKTLTITGHRDRR